MSVYYVNVRTLRTKLHHLLQSVPLVEHVINILTETWLKCTFHNSELHFDGFVIYRSDYSAVTSVFSRGGGVLIATKKYLVTKLLPSSIDLEHMFVLIHVRTRNLLISTAYIPPVEHVYSLLALLITHLKTLMLIYTSQGIVIFHIAYSNTATYHPSLFHSQVLL